jgi:hypothetical protein
MIKKGTKKYYIYLDTSHLQKWQQGTLTSHEINLLNKLQNSGNYEFVISIAHIIDITDQKDSSRICDMGNFIDQLPKKWLCDSLEEKEIKSAIRLYRTGQMNQINPFVSDFVDILKGDVLNIRIKSRDKSLKEIFQELASCNIHKTSNLNDKVIRRWTDNNHYLLDIMKSPEKKEKNILNNLVQVLKNKITNFNLYEEISDAVISKTMRIVSPIDEFIYWVMGRPSLIPSILCPYYTMHSMLRNKGMPWKKSHIDDLIHLQALAYVDYLSTDNQICSFIMEAEKLAKKHFDISWGKKIITSIEQINFPICES